MDETFRYSQDDIRKTKGIAWLSYVNILFLIPMLIYKDSKYSKFHVNQGITLFLLQCILTVFIKIMHLIPFIRWISWILNFLHVPLVILMILGIINALEGRAKRLPFIGNIQIYN